MQEVALSFGVPTPQSFNMSGVYVYAENSEDCARGSK